MSTLNRQLNLALFPLDIVYADPEANLSQLRDIISRVRSGCDLLVLPELFTTAFVADGEEALRIAEPADDAADRTLATLRELSRKYNMAICGSYLKTDADGRPANRCVLMEPSGEYHSYFKHHLFCLSKESKVYGSGPVQSPVARYRGWNICMAVCYDLRFPAWLRNLKLRYDLLVIPANWPDSRSYAWHHLLIARAIENQAVVAGADRSGSDKFGDYSPEMCQVYDFMGQPVGQRDKASGLVYAIVDKQSLDEYRQRIPFWTDADDYRFV